MQLKLSGNRKIYKQIKPNNNMKNKEESKVMHCPKCNEVVSINGCTWVEKMCVAYKTYKEVNSRIGKEILKQGMMKNGIIQGLHRQIGNIYENQELLK